MKNLKSFNNIISGGLFLFLPFIHAKKKSVFSFCIKGLKFNKQENFLAFVLYFLVVQRASLRKIGLYFLFGCFLSVFFVFVKRERRFTLDLYFLKFLFFHIQTISNSLKSMQIENKKRLQQLGETPKSNNNKKLLSRLFIFK